MIESLTAFLFLLTGLFIFSDKTDTKTEDSLAIPPSSVEYIQDFVWNNHNDHPIRLRLYHPSGEGPFPVLLYIHGGGWIYGDIETGGPTCQEISRLANCLVVSIDYSKAPQFPFPNGLQDCYAALEWIAQSIIDYGGDPQRIAVMGESAGGNLAAALTLYSRDHNGPEMTCQILVCPATNYDFETESYRQSQHYTLTKRAMKRYWNLYLYGHDGSDPYASPLQGNLEQLPPALIIVAEFDALRDDGLLYADRLESFQVPVVVHRYLTDHAFLYYYDTLEEARHGLNTIVDYLKEHFSLNPSQQLEHVTDTELDINGLPV